MSVHSHFIENSFRILIPFLLIIVQVQLVPCPDCPCPWYETNGNNDTQTFHKNALDGCHEICDNDANGCMTCCLNCCESNVTSCYGWSWSKELGCMAESAPPPSSRTGIFVHGYHAICYDMMNPDHLHSACRGPKNLQKNHTTNGKVPCVYRATLCPPCPCVDSSETGLENDATKLTTTNVPPTCPTCECDWTPPENHPLRKLHPLALPGCAPLCENDLECMTCCDSCCYKDMDSCLGFAWSRQLGCMQASKNRQSRALGVFEILGVHAMCNEISHSSSSNDATCPPCFCPFSTTTETTTTTITTTTTEPKECPICPCQNQSASIASNEPPAPLGCDLACHDSESCMVCCDNCCYNDYESCSGFHWSKGLGCQSDDGSRAAFQIEGIHVVCNALVHHQVDKDGNCPTCDCMTLEPNYTSTEDSSSTKSTIELSPSQGQTTQTLHSNPSNDSQHSAISSSVSPIFTTTPPCPKCPCSDNDDQPDPNKMMAFYSNGCGRTCNNVTECVDCCMDCCGRSITCIGFAWAKGLGCLMGKKSKGAFQIDGVHAICQVFSPNEEELDEICPPCPCLTTEIPPKMSTLPSSTTSQSLPSSTSSPNSSPQRLPELLLTAQPHQNRPHSTLDPSSFSEGTSMPGSSQDISTTHLPTYSSMASSSGAFPLDESSKSNVGPTTWGPSSSPDLMSTPFGPTFSTRSDDAAKSSSEPVPPIGLSTSSDSNLDSTTPPMLITTTPLGQVCPPCPCLEGVSLGTGSTTASFRLSTCLNICSNDPECQQCCDDCCHNPNKRCIGFAYSPFMGCLTPKSMKGVAEVFGIHALCQDVPEDPSFLVQVTPTCPTCPCSSNSIQLTSSTEPNLVQTTQQTPNVEPTTSTTTTTVQSSSTTSTAINTKVTTAPTTIVTTKGKVCEPCSCRAANNSGTGSSSPQSISGCNQVCGESGDECLACCESCCLDENSACRGFAFSQQLGCLKRKKTKSILQIPGTHAICSSVPPTINLSLQVMEQCPPCDCSTTVEPMEPAFVSHMTLYDIGSTTGPGPSEGSTSDMSSPKTSKGIDSSETEAVEQTSSTTKRIPDETSVSPSSTIGPSTTPSSCESCANGDSRPVPVNVFSGQASKANSQGEFMLQSGFFQLATPNYPFCSYENNLNLTWKFQLGMNDTIRAKVLELKLEESESCTKDALRMIGFRSTNIDPRFQCSRGDFVVPVRNGFNLCGYVVSTTFESIDKEVAIQFVSNESGTNAGFHLLLEVV